MAWAALIMVAAGLGYAFGVRSYLAWRATGDTGLRIGAGRTGSVTWWAKMLFAVSIVLVVSGPVIALTGPGFLLWPVSTTWQAVGLLATAAGILVVIAAQHGMGSSWRIGVDDTEVTGLITGGLFSLARNPIFTGMTVFAAGIALLVPGFVSAAGLAVLIAAVELQVRAVEEPYLSATHGQAYRHYASHTGRFLPAIGKLGNP